MARRLHSSQAEVYQRKAMKKLITFFAAAALSLAPMTASAARVFVGVRPFYGPAYYPAYWGPAYYGPGYYPYAGTGEVKIDTRSKDAQVYINGAFAGYTKDARTLHLRPGEYNIEVRGTNNQVALNEKVFVTPGKTLHVHPNL